MNWNLISKLFIYLLLINIIHCRYSAFNRDDTEPGTVAPKMYKLINENFMGKNGENNFYTKNISDYSVELKFLFLNFNPEEIKKDSLPSGRKFFSYININIDFILSLKFTKNKINEGVDIIYGPENNSSNLIFKLKNLYANIYLDFIEFENQPNSTYKYQIGKTRDISFDKTEFRYTNKINKILEDNMQDLKLFLFESFESYLKNITNSYPKANEILLYETVLEYIKAFKSFPISTDPKYSNHKIVFKQFKEEKITCNGREVFIINIRAVFDIRDDYYTNSYNVIIPYISCHDEYFIFKTDEMIKDIPLSKILDHVFGRIINYYIDDYQ